MKKRYYFIAIAILLALIIVGSIYDYQIDSAIYWKNNPISIIIAAIAEYPAFGGLALISGILYASNERLANNLFVKICVYFGATLYICTSGYFMGESFCDSDAIGYYLPFLTNKIVSTLVGLALVAPMFIWGLKLAKTIPDNRIFWSIIVVSFAIGVSFVIAYVTKLIMDRPRFSYITEYNHIELFTNWWSKFGATDHYMELDGVTSEVFKSFPSGHATYGASIMVLLTNLDLVFGEKFATKKPQLFFIGFGAILVVGFTRILCGAHYLTDVAIGILVSIVNCIIANIIINRYFKKPVEE